MISRKRFLMLSAAATVSACAQRGADQVKIGFIVKQPEEAWFQSEIRFAERAAAQAARQAARRQGLLLRHD